MLTRPFGNTGLDVSVIGLGTWNIGNQWGEVDEATAFATVRAALDSGVNFFDTADAYGIPVGLSEQRLGRALAGDRHRVVIVSKAGNWARRAGHPLPFTCADHVRLCAHASLHRLRTDYLDVLLCHLQNLEDPSVFLDGFEALREEGCLRYFGISTNDLDVLKRFNRNRTCAVVQVEYSLLRRAPEAEFFPYCRENAIAVMVRGPLAQGLLSGRYARDTKFTDSVRAAIHADRARQARFERDMETVEGLKGALRPGEDLATMALRFAISHPVGPIAIPGAKSPEQATMNARAGAAALPDEARERLLAALG